jgi:hypothetical protein
MPLLSSTEMLTKGLEYAKVDVKRKWNGERLQDEFHAQYGSDSTSVAMVWYHLTEKENLPLKPEDMLSKVEKQKGLRRFLMAMHFLWAYNRNCKELGRKFNVCDSYAKGKHLWKWIRRISSLAADKILWSHELDDPDGPTNVIWIDCVDMPTWEKKHPTLPKDPGMFTHKYARSGVKYQVVVAVHQSKVVGIYGPYRGGEGDQAILDMSGVLDKLKNGKLAVVDKGYINHAWKDKLSWPNPHESPAVSVYKGRIRMRGETFNGRVKFFKILRECFRHSLDYHKDAFTAVAVLVQYQMDYGMAPLYSV